MIDMFQKVNKQKKEIVNQKQQKLVHSLGNKTKIFQKIRKKFLKDFAAVGFGKLTK